MMLTDTDKTALSREIARLNPCACRRHPATLSGRRKCGYVRLMAVMPGSRAELLLLRLPVQGQDEADRTYMAVNEYLASRPDWGGIQAADAGEDVPLTLDQFQGDF